MIWFLLTTNTNTNEIVMEFLILTIGVFIIILFATRDFITTSPNFTTKFVQYPFMLEIAVVKLIYLHNSQYNIQN